MRNRVFRALVVVGASLMMATGLVTLPETPSVAVSGSEFNPGNIISDANFYNSNAMTEAQIQSFLDAMIGSCNNSRCLNILTQNTYGRSADRTICSAYSGAANERASRVIFKVQKACGISAKVLLVTLQKEMGLVTSKGPSQWAVDHALGYACPDTAPCDSSRAGFYNQVYSAAWQFKRYSTPTPWGGYQPGWRAIQFHPNASCGSSNVFIENNATAALYNYTPYQPTAGALAAYPGISPPCGSYGNRNFWFFYNNWFGPSAEFDGAADINDAYDASGGASGPLGEPSSALDCPPTAVQCSQTFNNGYIGWTVANGAFLVTGRIADYYRTNGGPEGALGHPVDSETAFVFSGNGDGLVQVFQGGYVYSSAAGEFTVVPNTPLGDVWVATGWIRGSLGWPVGDEICSNGGCSQEFQNGWIGSTKPGSAFVVSGTIGDSYKARGGVTGPLGHPTGRANQFVVSGNGDGLVQVFQGGYLYSSAAGVFKVVPKSPLEQAWIAEGWIRGSLGWPVGDEICSNGGCSQEFQNGWIGSTKPGSAFVVSGTIGDSYKARGGVTGPLGHPTGRANQFVVSGNGDGLVQVFQGGYLYSSAAGVFKVVPKSPLEQAWIAEGWIRGALGWPVSDEVCAAGVCSQEFQGAMIKGSPPRVVWGVSDPDIEAYWNAQGGSGGPLGDPIGDAGSFVTADNGNGLVQVFQGGYVYSSAAGVFKVVPKSPLEQAWIAEGWIRGALGWPVSDEVCAAGVCSQEFQGAMIKGSPPRVVWGVSDPDIEAYWNAQGGSGGPLGDPIGDAGSFVTADNGNGLVQVFQGGYVYSSAAGVFKVVPKSPLEQAWIAEGWIRGALGWPVSDEVCAAGVCSQEFQGGMLTR